MDACLQILRAMMKLPSELEITFRSRSQLIFLPRTRKGLSDTLRCLADGPIFHIAGKMAVPFIEGNDLSVSCALGCVASWLSIDDAANYGEAPRL